MSLQNAIDQLVKNSLNGIHTCMPGKILSYDGEKRRANVLPLIKKKYLDNSELSYKPITDVPVSFYGVNECYIQLPDSEFKDQNVILIFSQRALDSWVINGKENTPLSFRKFSVTDAIAILSISAFNKKWTKSNDLNIKYKTSRITIKQNGNIEMGASVFQKLVNEAFMTLYNAHTHICASPGSPSTPPVVLMTNLQLTSKVQAE
jgi:hypothetical protein